MGNAWTVTAELVAIETFQIAQVSRCLRKLDSIKEPFGDGSLLDRTVVTFLEVAWAMEGAIPIAIFPFSLPEEASVTGDTLMRPDETVIPCPCATYSSPPQAPRHRVATGSLRALDLSTWTMRSLWATIFLIFAFAESNADTALLRKYFRRVSRTSKFQREV